MKIKRGLKTFERFVPGAAKIWRMAAYFPEAQMRAGCLPSY